MRALPDFALHRPATLEAATALLARTSASRAVAGGTDLLPNLRHGLEEPAALVDLGGIAGFATLERGADGALVLGAGVTLATLAVDATVAQALPALAAAAQSVAAPTHRSAATLGGNLCQDTRCVFYNQSAWWRASNGWCLKRGGTRCHVAPQGDRCHAAFCSDLAPVLMAAGAAIDVTSHAGSRRLPLHELYRDDGAAHLALAPGELLVRVHVPAPAAGVRVAFGKVRSRGGIDFPLASVAVAAAVDGGRVRSLHAAVSGTGSWPVLLAGTAELEGSALDDALLGKLRQLVQRQVQPMRSTVTPAQYRRDAAATLAARLLRSLAD